MGTLKTESCPNCGKGEFIRYSTELDYHETCPVCGERITLPGNLKKPLRVDKILDATMVSAEDSWEKICADFRNLATS